MSINASDRACQPAERRTFGGYRPLRVAISILIGVLAGSYNLWVRLSGHFTFSDFDQVWIGARAALHGQNPYSVVPQHFAWPLFYPMPAVVVAIPFVGVPIEWAAALWTTLGFGLLAYALIGRNPWLLLLLATNPAVNAMQLAQWSPILTAAALLPGFAWLVLAKPTTGASVVGAFLDRVPSRQTIGIAALLLATSFALCPTWMSQWLAAVKTSHHFIPLVLRPWGWIMLAAAVRWRRPEARLLLFLSIVPSTMAAYEAVALFLVPATRIEILLLAVLTVGAQIGAAHTPDGLSFVEWLSRNSRYYFVFLYIPCLVLVLLRPNRLALEKHGKASE